MTTSETTRSTFLAEWRRTFRRLCRHRCQEAFNGVRTYNSYRPDADPEPLDPEDAIRLFWLSGACLVLDEMGFKLPADAVEIINTGIFRPPGGEADLMELEIEDDSRLYPLVPLEEFLNDD